jgi:hypothetical protein
MKFKLLFQIINVLFGPWSGQKVARKITITKENTQK